MDKSFFLEKRTEVTVGIAVPDGGGIRATKVVEGEEVMWFRISFHDVSTGGTRDLVKTIK